MLYDILYYVLPPSLVQNDLYRPTNAKKDIVEEVLGII